MTLEEQIKTVVDALADKKAADVKVYDVRGISGLCDAFVVATGSAAPHLKALVAGTQQAMKAVEREFKGSDWYVTIQRRIGHGERITEADWEEIERQLKVVYPNFVRNLSGLCRFSDVEWRTCLLIKLDVAPSDIAQTLHREASSISTIRSRLFQKVFDRKGSSREWDEFIASL